MPESQIVILDGYTINPGDNPWTLIERQGQVRLYDRSRPDEVVERSREADVLVINKIKMTADVFAQLDKLRLVAVTATGYDCVDLQAARQHGVCVCNVPEYGTDSVAQFVFSLLLHLVHNVALHDRLIRDGEWQRAGDFSFWRTPLVELAGKDMGVVGWGRIGQRVGQLARAFGMRVLACSLPPLDPAGFQPDAWRDLDGLFGEADVVSLHCPLTENTTGMVNRRLLSRMSPSSLLINTARGALIVESDLADALNNGQLAGAAVDVVSQEPIQPENPLLSASNCVLTPHIAWATLESRQRLLAVTSANIASFLRREPQNVVS